MHDVAHHLARSTFLLFLLCLSYCTGWTLGAVGELALRLPAHSVINQARDPFACIDQASAPVRRARMFLEAVGSWELIPGGSALHVRYAGHWLLAFLIVPTGILCLPATISMVLARHYRKCGVSRAIPMALSSSLQSFISTSTRFILVFGSIGLLDRLQVFLLVPEYQWSSVVGNRGQPFYLVPLGMGGFANEVRFPSALTMALWLLSFLCISQTIIAGTIIDARRRMARHRATCLSCGYSMSDGMAVCPECGASSPAKSTAVALFPRTLSMCLRVRAWSRLFIIGICIIVGCAGLWHAGAVREFWANQVYPKRLDLKVPPATIDVDIAMGHHALCLGSSGLVKIRVDSGGTDAYVVRISHWVGGDEAHGSARQDVEIVLNGRRTGDTFFLAGERESWVVPVSIPYEWSRARGVEVHPERGYVTVRMPLSTKSALMCRQY